MLTAESSELVNNKHAKPWTTHVVLPVAVFVLSRVSVLVTTQAVGWLHPDLSVRAALTAWDGGWYLHIAEHGYPPDLNIEPAMGANSWGFAPLYPLVIRLFSEATGLSLASAAVAISLIAGAIAMCLIHALVEPVLGRVAADAAIMLLCFHPAAYVLGMAYTESVFLLCAAGALLALQRRCLITAGACASGACLIRTPGLAVVAAVAVVALKEWRAGRRVRATFAVAVSLLGSAVWTGYQWLETGTPRAQQLAIERYWYGSFIWFSRPIRSTWLLLTSDDRWSKGADFLAALAFISILGCVAALIMRTVRREPRLPLDWHVYSVGSLLMAASAFWPMSILRYSLAAFPYLAVAISEVPARWRGPVYGVCGGLMCIFAAVAYLGLVTSPAPFAP